jgi:dihydrofolate reductase
MAKLVYIANVSLDGYTEDQDGRIDCSNPDEEYFGSVNGLQRDIGTHLYGRRMYEAMVYWETAPVADLPAWLADFTDLWRGAEKIVFSKTLASIGSGRAALERTFDVEAIRQMKAGAARDLSVGGADLAAQAFGAGLVDEYHVYVWPIALGGGKQALPGDLRLEFELLAERRFRNGAVHLHYRVGA